MNCSVYRSEKKQGAYLYLAQGKSFEDVPEELVKILGHCIEVMQLDLAQRDQLATEDIKVVIANLKEQGYHLQMPPKATVQVVNYGA